MATVYEIDKDFRKPQLTHTMERWMKKGIRFSTNESWMGLMSSSMVT